MSKNVVIFDIAMPYKTLSKTKARELHGLSRKKERDESGLFIAEGDKCVRAMLHAFEPEYIICNEDWIARNDELSEKYSDVIFLSDKRNIEIISSFTSLPDVISVFKKPQSGDVIPLLDKNRLYLLLDDIQDPGNLGTIIRTCDWFGVYDIFASENTVDVYSPKVVQSTMGSLARVKVHYCSLERLINNNKDTRVIGTLLSGTPLNKVENIKSGALIMGNEGRGISEELKKHIDIPLTIPPVNMHNHPDSLNVSIATAIILSHLT